MKLEKQFARAALWLICSAALLSLSVHSAQGADAKKPVMVSFLPFLESAERIAGGRLEVQTLLPVGASPHAFDPTPRDVINVRAASLLLLSGYGIDAWLERLWRAILCRHLELDKRLLLRHTVETAAACNQPAR